MIIVCSLDDTSLSYSSTNLLQIERKLNSDMNILNTWAETWLVKFNPQKTEFVIFSNKKNIDQVNILFNGENIKQVEYHAHLGVCLSSNCKWCYHINNTCQRATKRIHILRKLKYLLGIVAHCRNFFQMKLVSFGRWVVLSSLVWKKTKIAHWDLSINL
jgi:hypothetical protein